jgi:phosphatidylethanolamine-binding protein (PEBP) family uncharacterized protein
MDLICERLFTPGVRPLVNHGQHRYFFQLIGLNAQLGLPQNFICINNNIYTTLNIKKQ